MNFDDNASGPKIELSISRGESVHAVQCELSVSAKTPVQRRALVPTARISELAAWLDDLWDEKAAFTIPELSFELRYSHREHIGEVFYQVVVDGNLVKLVYEQAGTSNCARASELKRELARAIDG